MEAFELLLSQLLPGQNPSKRQVRRIESLLLDSETGEPLLTAREVQDLSAPDALRLLVDQ